MKSTILKAIALSLVFVICFSFVGCVDNAKEEEKVIYVGNTAATTGALANIGVPFNLGIEAAFAAYNAQGGFYGKTVALKHYDDKGESDKALALMEKLIYEDDIFAVVGNYGSYAVSSNLETLKENEIPMVYAAAGNIELFNDKATSDGDRGIFPVQPLNQTEGQMLILRAFAPQVDGEGNYVGGLGGTKVGVITNSDEASQATLTGIKQEAKASGLEGQVVYQNVATDDFSAAASALKAAGCDVIIVAVIGTPFISALTALANVVYTGKVLTSYNNSNAAMFNNEASEMTDIGLKILSTMEVYAQAWLDITSTTYYFKDANSKLYNGYKFIGKIQKDENGNELGVPGFTEEYWKIAENIYEYALSIGRSDAFNMSYNSYALAGYIAGDLFCQALGAMEDAGMELTRANLVDVLESKPFKIAMADYISYANGMRAGVESFALTVFYDTNTLTNDGKHTASSMTIHTLTSIEDYRKLISK